MDTDKYRGLPAISYARASMGKGRGQDDSTDRQKDGAVEYAQELGLNLDLNYRIVDEGVSAFKLTSKKDKYGRTTKIAKNLEEGALADFVNVVKSGRFPNGISLIVEKLDRLYRDKPRRALMHFLTLLEYNVTIHTLIDKKIYEPDSENDAIDLMTSIMYLVASHQYSKDLSDRIKISYKRRIEKMLNDDEIVLNTGVVFDWVQIKIDPDTNEKRFFISDANKNLIQRMYMMYLDNMSYQDICNILNKEGIYNFNGDAWTADRVGQVLKSKANIGIYNPRKGTNITRESLRVVSDADWQKCKEIREKKAFGKGKQSKDGNIFSELLYCGYCKSKQKRLKGHPWDFSRITYRRSPDKRGENLPIFNKRKVRILKCNGGEESAENCCNKEISYYPLHDSFFSFIQDLDFSALVDMDSKLDNQIAERKVLETKAEISELDIKINDQKRLLPLIKNDNELKKIAETINDLGDEKDELIKLLEDQQDNLRKHIQDKQALAKSKQNIQELLELANNDNFYMALQAKLIEYGKIPDGELDAKQKAERKDIYRIWDIKREIKDAVFAKDTELEEKLEKEDIKLQKKYFKDEIEKDSKAYEFRKKLNLELKRFIKRVVYYPFGFPLEEASLPFNHRKGRSTYDKHSEELLEYLESRKSVSLKDLKPKRKSGWSEQEIITALGIPRTTYRNYVNRKQIPHLVKTKKNLSQVWKAFVKIGKKDIKSSYNNSIRDKLMMFGGYKIEFTDICKPDVVKYVVPYHNDPTSGISYNLNRKTKMLVQDFAFGKSKRNEQIHRPDPIFIKANVLMDDHVDAGSESMVLGYISAIPRKIHKQIEEGTGMIEYSGTSDSWMIPHEWKEKSLDEIMKLIKKNLLWTAEQIAGQKGYHPLILKEKNKLKNPADYEPLWLYC